MLHGPHPHRSTPASASPGGTEDVPAGPGSESPYWSEERTHVADLVPADARRILDVGCNDGSFGAGVLRRLPGREVWGVEPHQLDAQQASTRLTGVVNDLYPDALHEVPGSFDCVSFNHVLEHIVDPWDALRRTRERLTPGAVIIGDLSYMAFAFRARVL